MANLQNNVMIGVEQELDLCLNQKGMTNEQALNHIEKELGTYKREIAKLIILERQAEDRTGQSWDNFHRTNRSLHQGD
jgi:hypothetical protein